MDVHSLRPIPIPRLAGLLSVAGLRRAAVASIAPPLAVSRGSLPPERGAQSVERRAMSCSALCAPRSEGRGVGKFLWEVPAAALRAGPDEPATFVIILYRGSSPATSLLPLL